MSNMFGGEVGKLEERLADALRGKDNAERNSERLSGLLGTAKSEAMQLGKRVDTLVVEKAGVERQLGEARGAQGKVAAAEQAAAAATKRAVKAEAEVAALSGKLAKALGERDQARDDLAGTRAENDRLAAEIDPVRALAVAVLARADAEDRMVVEARKVRAAP